MEGDETRAHVVGEQAFDIGCDQSRGRALQGIRACQKTLPTDWKFDRDEANSRESGGPATSRRCERLCQGKTSLRARWKQSTTTSIACGIEVSELTVRV